MGHIFTDSRAMRYFHQIFPTANTNNYDNLPLQKCQNLQFEKFGQSLKLPKEEEMNENF